MQLLEGNGGVFCFKCSLKTFWASLCVVHRWFCFQRALLAARKAKKRGQAKEVMHLCVRLVASQAVLRSCRSMFTQWFRCKSEKNHNPQFKSPTASHMSCQLAETVSLIVVQFSMRS